MVLLACASVTGASTATTPDWLKGWGRLDDARLSQPIYKKTVFERLRIVADDGVTLDARVIRPVTAKGVHVPVVLHPSTYFAADLQAAQIAPQLQALHYVQRGYALVGVSLRGTGGSGGCVDYQGRRDLKDMNTILDTIARQPWSNGRIGAIGLSWDGTAVNQAIVSGNRHLFAAVPAEGITDWYKWSFLNGVPSWFIGYSFNAYAPATVGGAAFGPAQTGSAVPHLGERVCAWTPEAVTAQYRAAATGVRDTWWDERDLVRSAGRANARLAVMQLGGYRDEGVRADNLTAWDTALRKRLPNYHLVIGDWGHLWPDTPDLKAPRNPDLRFNPHPVTTWPAFLLRWWDRWLKSRNNGIDRMPGALLQDDNGQWFAEDGLEPSRAHISRLYPRTAGTLASSRGSGAASFVDNGMNVDPRGTCFYVAVGLEIGCAPAQSGNARFFVGGALHSATRLTGVGHVRLKLTHSAPIGHVGVTVYRVHGARWEALTYGMATDNLPDPHTFVLRTPGEQFTLSFDLLPRDAGFAKGDRIGIAIGSQVGRYPLGAEGNGYLPVVSGGVTSVDLSATSIDLPIAPLTGAITLR